MYMYELILYLIDDVLMSTTLAPFSTSALVIMIAMNVAMVLGVGDAGDAGDVAEES
jgi:hypothetical protein